MAKGIKIGDEVAIVAKKGDRWELVGQVTHIDGDSATVHLGVPVTVDIDKHRLVSAYKPPVDEPT